MNTGNRALMAAVAREARHPREGGGPVHGFRVRREACGLSQTLLQHS